MKRRDPSMSLSRTWTGLAAVLFLGLILRWPVASIPLERDEGEYAYIAQRWLLGEVPYKASFDQKPPGAFVAYALIQRLAAESPAAIHWGAQVYTLMTIGLAFLLGRKLFGGPAGFAAGAFCAFLTVDHSLLGNAANAEIFMIAPLTAAFLAALLTRERGSWRWALACGALSGLGLLFKQVALTNALFHLGLIAWSRRRGLLVAAFLGGLAAALVPTAAYFLAVDAWREFYECVIGYNLRYSGDIPLSSYPANFWRSFAPTLRSLWPFQLLALAALVRPAGPAVRLVLVWLAFSSLGACLGGFFRPHYFLQAVPALAVLAGSAVRRLSGERRWAGFALTGVAVLCGVLAGSWYYAPGSPEEKCRRIYQANPFPESADVARLIAQNSAEQDRVLVFGSEAQILYLARRRSATRYIYLYPLFRPYPDTARRQREALQQIRESSPKHIVTVFAHTSFLASVRAPLGIFSELRAILEDYRLVAVMETGRQGRPVLRVGEEARRLWQRSPMWYDRLIWGSLAVWERKG